MKKDSKLTIILNIVAMVVGLGVMVWGIWYINYGETKETDKVTLSSGEIIEVKDLKNVENLVVRDRDLGSDETYYVIQGKNVKKPIVNSVYLKPGLSGKKLKDIGLEKQGVYKIKVGGKVKTLFTNEEMYNEYQGQPK